jgi:hypothetical protein
MPSQPSIVPNQHQHLRFHQRFFHAFRCQPVRAPRASIPSPRPQPSHNSDLTTVHSLRLIHPSPKSRTPSRPSPPYTPTRPLRAPVPVPPVLRQQQVQLLNHPYSIPPSFAAATLRIPDQHPRPIPILRPLGLAIAPCHRMDRSTAPPSLLLPRTRLSLHFQRLRHLPALSAALRDRPLRGTIDALRCARLSVQTGDIFTLRPGATAASATPTTTPYSAVREFLYFVLLGTLLFLCL